jgi:enoyl-CoA hydratase/carnithine racemase
MILSLGLRFSHHGGLSQKPPYIIGLNRGKELSLSGKLLDVVTAEWWGLVNRIVEPGEDVVLAAIEIAESILQNKQDMVLKYKSILNDGVCSSVELYIIEG